VEEYFSGIKKTVRVRKGREAHLKKSSQKKPSQKKQGKNSLSHQAMLKRERFEKKKQRAIAKKEGSI